MASTAAHRSTGWAVGVIAAAIISRHISDPYYVWTIATLIAGYAGGTAPDWLETAWWSRRHALWITHRTWTHWGVAWVALLVASYAWLGRTPAAAPVFGFAAGGLMHLLADWPNPLGVPWLLTRRYSLKWWQSGRCDYLIILAAWLTAVWYADQTWLRGIVWRHASSSLNGGMQALFQLLPWSHRDAIRQFLMPFA